MPSNRYIDFLIVGLIIVTCGIAILSLNGCAIRGKVSKYDVNCSACRVQITYTIQDDEIKKGF